MKVAGKSLTKYMSVDSPTVASKYTVIHQVKEKYSLSNTHIISYDDVKAINTSM